MICNHCGQTSNSVYGQADGSVICSECLRRAKDKDDGKNSTEPIVVQVVEPADSEQ